jgi:Zn-dependent protease
VADFLQHIDVASVLIEFVVLLFSLSIHEASHAWMADRCGDHTARYLGRVTLNPIAHIDPVGTLLFPLLQFVTGMPLIGWAKPVPLNSVHLRNPHRDQIFVSLAGPGSNLITAGVVFVLLAAFKLSSPLANGIIINMATTMRIPHESTILVPLLGLLFFAFVINLLLALFNLIPIPPLDGHWLLYRLLPYDAAKVLARMNSYGILIIYALMLMGLFRFIYMPVQVLVELLVRL